VKFSGPTRPWPLSRHVRIHGESWRVSGPYSDCRLGASESLTTQSWNQRVALCLPEAACTMSRRPVLSEIGPDRGALRAEDRFALLFDLGPRDLAARRLYPLESDFDVVCGESAVEVIFKPANGEYTFNIHTDEKGYGPLTFGHVRHKGVTGDTAEYPPSDVLSFARRLALRILQASAEADANPKISIAAHRRPAIYLPYVVVGPLGASAHPSKKGRKVKRKRKRRHPDSSVKRKRKRRQPDSQRVRHLLSQAERCDAQATFAATPEAVRTFRELAEQWRELARQSRHFERNRGE
jgi:hypothetical protein